MGVPDFDFGRLIVSCVAVGAVLGAAVMLGLPWLWGAVKPLLHAATA